MLHPREVPIIHQTVSRHDWAHGLKACPTCGLPLDPDKDTGGYLQLMGSARAFGVYGNHHRCGSSFTFLFDDDQAAG